MNSHDFSHFYNTSFVLDDGKAGPPRRVHLFEQRDVEAIETALKARRPLLLRGEPGVGKSQLAEAFARKAGWRLFPKTLDANTDPDDLKWYEDSVSRLAKAQFAGAAGGAKDVAELEEQLERRKFIRKGPLWQAFESDKPSVVLIDEIDKADVSVPNALLEALGSGRFQPPDNDMAPIVAKHWPLVILTTNEDRPLPPAFLRRCLVHSMDPPEDIRKWMVDRGVAVQGEEWREFLGTVADAVLEDRGEAQKLRLDPLPGLAEYLDLLRVLFHGGETDFDRMKAELDKCKNFVLRKHRAR